MRSEIDESQILVHDEKAGSSAIAFMLAQLGEPSFPVPLGVLRAVERPTYEQLLEEQIVEAKSKHGKTDLQKLLAGNETWMVN